GKSGKRAGPCGGLGGCPDILAPIGRFCENAEQNRRFTKPRRRKTGHFRTFSDIRESQILIQFSKNAVAMIREGTSERTRASISPVALRAFAQKRAARGDESADSFGKQKKVFLKWEN